MILGRSSEDLGWVQDSRKGCRGFVSRPHDSKDIRTVGQCCGNDPGFQTTIPQGQTCKLCRVVRLEVEGAKCQDGMVSF